MCLHLPSISGKVCRPTNVKRVSDQIFQRRILFICSRLVTADNFLHRLFRKSCRNFDLFLFMSAGCIGPSLQKPSMFVLQLVTFILYLYLCLCYIVFWRKVLRQADDHVLNFLWLLRPDLLMIVHCLPGILGCIWQRGLFWWLIFIKRRFWFSFGNKLYSLGIYSKWRGFSRGIGGRVMWILGRAK